MVFSSAPFLFIFLPILFLVYSCIRNLRAQNVLLVAASLLFYGYGEPTFVIVMVASVLINYLLALGIVKKAGRRKVFLVVAIAFNLALIGVFKYAAFAVMTVNGLLHTHAAVPQIALPIGISFFTFQILSYVVDVYREPEMVQKNFGRVLLYVSFFPQLIAGPIVKYHDVYTYINSRKQTASEVAIGIRRFVLGLSKKLFLANAMGAVADQMFNLNPADMSAPTAWIGAVCYIMQIFFDFSGYSDMAIGLGHMFGFTFLENFDHPYISTSIKEFWRRWHISLSTWFREYLYIPLGGNRKGKLRTELNKLIVFFFTGLWHGASWNFVIWGMIHGVAIVIEDLCKGGKKQAQKRQHPARKAIGWLYTILIVIVAFVLFRADNFAQGGAMIAHMFAGGIGGAAAFNACMQVLTPWNILLFAISLAACYPIGAKLRARFVGPDGTSPAWLHNASYLLTVVMLLLCILNIANASYNPFIYFRF